MFSLSNLVNSQWFVRFVASLFAILGASCVDGPEFEQVADNDLTDDDNDVTADDDATSDDDSLPTDDDTSEQISEQALADPAACPPDATLMAVRREADGIYYLYGVVQGQIELMEPLGTQPVVTLGETDPAEISSHTGAVLIALDLDYRNLQVCIARFHETGEGKAWPGGANILDVQEFRDKIIPWGFDLPNLKVALLAASGPANNRFLYGNERDTGMCEVDDIHPQHPIGYYVGCESDLLLRDQGSYWTLVGNEFNGYISGAAFASTGERFGVAAGPNARTDTFYAASNWGIHFHTEADLYRYEDDRFAYLTCPPGQWQQGWPLLLAWRSSFVSWDLEFPGNAPPGFVTFHH